ncbi:MAG: winged helix-turn-helix domain-containing protein [Candidatus Anstonellales archaeon]
MAINNSNVRKKLLNSLIIFLLFFTIVINISIIIDSLKINELKEKHKQVTKAMIENESNLSVIHENNFSITGISQDRKIFTEQKALTFTENGAEVNTVEDSYMRLSKQKYDILLIKDELVDLKLSYIIKNLISLFLMILIFFAFKFVSQDENEYFYKSNLIRLLNSDTRIKTIEALRKAPRTITDLSKITGKSKATVFEHLVLLMKEGLVEKEEIPGKKLVFYKLKNKHLSIWNDLHKLRDS